MRVTGSRVISVAAMAAVAVLTLSAEAPVRSAGAPAPSWPQPRYGPARTGDNPAETQLSTGNVAKLVLAHIS